MPSVKPCELPKAPVSYSMYAFIIFQTLETNLVQVHLIFQRVPLYFSISVNILFLSVRVLLINNIFYGFWWKRRRDKTPESNHLLVMLWIFFTIICSYVYAYPLRIHIAVIVFVYICSQLFVINCKQIYVRIYFKPEKDILLLGIRMFLLLCCQLYLTQIQLHAIQPRKV